jgi:hypothetical protein
MAIPIRGRSPLTSSQAFNVSEANLAKMSTSGNWFSIPNYITLLSYIENASKPALDTPLTVTVRMDNDIKPNSGFESLELKVELTNCQAEALKPPVLVLFKANRFFASCEIICSEPIPGHGAVRQVMKLLANPGRREFDFPEVLEFLLQHNGNEWSGTQAFDTGFLRGEFLTGETYNVLLFGERGAGKSSTINSLLTCLKRADLLQVGGCLFTSACLTSSRPSTWPTFQTT